MQSAERISFRDPSDNVIYQRHKLAYMEAKKFMHGRVAELGCGEGYGINMLSPYVEEFHAFDKYAPDLTFIENVQNIKFHQMSFPPVAWEDSYYDVAVSFQVIEHIQDDRKFVSEIARILKKGGLLLLTTPNKPMSLTRNPWHIREYLKDELMNILQSAFSEVSIKGISGNEKVMDYFHKNRESVRRILRWDILNLQYRLPASWLRIPYDLFNRINRKKLLSADPDSVLALQSSDYFLTDDLSQSFDFFCIAKK